MSQMFSGKTVEPGGFAVLIHSHPRALDTVGWSHKPGFPGFRVLRVRELRERAPEDQALVDTENPVGGLRLITQGLCCFFYGPECLGFLALL